MKSFLVVLGIFCFSSLFAQSDFDQRLLEKFSAERIAELNTDHPEVIEYWTYYLDNSYMIIDGDATGKLLATGESIKIKKMEEFNILDYDIHMDRNMRKSFDIAGTNSYLILLSNSEFSKAYNNQRK